MEPRRNFHLQKTWVKRFNSGTWKSIKGLQNWLSPSNKSTAKTSQRLKFCVLEFKDLELIWFNVNFTITCQTASHFTSSGIVTTGPSKLWRPPHPDCGSYIKYQEKKNEHKYRIWLILEKNKVLLSNSCRELSNDLNLQISWCPIFTLAEELIKDLKWCTVWNILPIFLSSLNIKWGQKQNLSLNIIPYFSVENKLLTSFSSTSVFFTEMEKQWWHPWKKAVIYYSDRYVHFRILHFSAGHSAAKSYSVGGWEGG